MIKDEMVHTTIAQLDDILPCVNELMFRLAAKNNLNITTLNSLTERLIHLGTLPDFLSKIIAERYGKVDSNFSARIHELRLYSDEVNNRIISIMGASDDGVIANQLKNAFFAADRFYRSAVTILSIINENDRFEQEEKEDEKQEVEANE